MSTRTAKARPPHILPGHHTPEKKFPEKIPEKNNWHNYWCTFCVRTPLQATPENSQNFKQFRDTPYYVSHQGKIFRKFRAARKQPERYKELAGSLGTHGYPRVNLSVGGIQRSIEVHLMVAEVFLGPRPEEGMVVNHKNGVKTDNRPENLEWVTQSENQLHALRTGLHVHHSKITVEQVRAIRRSTLSHGKIAKKYGLHRQSVIKIRRRERWATV